MNNETGWPHPFIKDEALGTRSWSPRMSLSLQRVGWMHSSLSVAFLHFFLVSENRLIIDNLILDEVFGNILNNHQGRGKCYKPMPHRKNRIRSFEQNKGKSNTPSARNTEKKCSSLGLLRRHWFKFWKSSVHCGHCIQC